MKRDLRGEPLWKEVAEYFRRAHEPFGEQLRAASDLSATADGRLVAFAGIAIDAFGAPPRSRIGIVDLASGEIARVTGDSGNARLPRFSSNGEYLGYLAERDAPGRFQVVVEEFNAPRRVLTVPMVDGTVESFAWSPDGASILIQTAALGADRSGAAGSGTLEASSDLPAWMPEVEEAVPAEMWRSLWLWRVGHDAAERIAPENINVWEAAWYGDDAVLAIASTNPRESAWYSATLLRLDPASGEQRVLYAPREQLGVPAGDPSGRYAAVIEACCSDRTVVAGEVVVVSHDGDVRRFVPDGIDVTYVAWRDVSTLFCIGLRGFETVAGDLDVASGEFTVSFVTRETCGPWYPAAAILPNGGCALALESYGTYQRIAVVERGDLRVVYDFANEGSRFVASVGGRVEPATWSGRDGLEITGYLALPNGPGPHPLVVLVHGGPVYAFRNAWSMAYIFTPLLVARGYAVLHPNPRGSSGRGQAFARMVRGDMLGEDTYDIIAGVKALVDRGVVDRARVAVTGRSYGGMMASWLVTQTDVFAAAIPMAPVTDNVAQHFTSNIPYFDELFFEGSVYDVGGIFTQRSPVLHARSAKTPTLNVAGGRDRCTPPTQAMEFHRALVENGVESELVIYPGEGHHIEGIDAQIDLCTRMLEWLDRYAPAERA